MANEVHEPQLELFKLKPSKNKVDLSSTFADNMKLPIHKWYRYTAGFSASWVKKLIVRENGQNVLDPFSGSGTVMIEGEFSGINSIGIEAHPYVYRIAKAKLSWQIDVQDFKEAAKRLLENAKKIKIAKTQYPALIIKCYPEEIIQKLESLKQAWLKSFMN